MRLAESSPNRYFKLAVRLIQVIMILFVLSLGAMRASGQGEFAEKKMGRYEYGFPYSPSQVLRGVVSSGETLSEILRSHNVPYGRILEVSLKSKGVFDVHSIKAGKRYFIVKCSDSQNYPRYRCPQG
jgi:hypothetical protein